MSVPVIMGVDMASTPDKTLFAIRKGTTVVLSAGAGLPAAIDEMWINGLNANRKAGREALALAFTAIAGAHGAAIERRDNGPNPGFRWHSIALRLSLGGVGAMLDIDNIHGGAYALIHWHNVEYPARNFTTRFCGNVGSWGNGRAHHKATTCPNDWYSLAMYLDAGLRLAASGDAFEPSDI